MSSIPCIYMCHGGGDITTADLATCGCTGQGPWAQAWAAAAQAEQWPCADSAIVGGMHKCIDV